MYDLLIIGAGPAAYSCAITARKRNLSVAIVGSGHESGWLWKTDRIDNYPGMPGVSGRELLSVFAEHAAGLGVESIRGVARQVQPMGKRGFMVLVGNDILESRAVALCMGAARPRLLTGEEELLGRGVSWCGTCDGMFYRGKRVAVLSYWQGGQEDADFLAGLAAKTDYYSMTAHPLPEAPAYHVAEGRPTAIARRQDGQLVLKLGNEERAYDGVFVFRPAVAAEKMVPGLATDGPFIQVDRAQRTSVARVYAAGDCTGEPLQVAKAVGEGNVAAISCAQDLAEAKA